MSDPQSNDQTQTEWQRDLLNRLAFANLNEQRRTRRWNIFFKLLIFTYLLIILISVNPNWYKNFSNISSDGIELTAKHTALIEIAGVIAADTEASADTVITGLRNAFEDKDTAGIILRINSPGGSPVQAGYINDEIIRLRQKYPQTPIYTVITDICASGGYYIAAATDKIYADKASIVGSIGVLMNGFGFVETLNKLGVERRLLTAGEHKGFLDPFSPMKETDVAHVQTVLGQIHQQFVNVVKTGRGERLKDKEHPELFSGLIWTGEQGIKLGLVDELGSASHVARDVIGAEEIIDFTPQPNYLEQFAQRFGSTMTNSLAQQLNSFTVQ
jgi:protease-4